jgi:1-pyrroline-5-carboxylate dehydrogenase
MLNATVKVPTPVNEPVLSYAPGTPERALLVRTMEELSRQTLELPLIIGGREVRTGQFGEALCPHRHRQVLARYHKAGAAEVEQAIAAAREAHGPWSRLPWQHRAAVFLRAADLLATKYRPILNAATMLGQSKTAHQAEIDSACEMIDFFRWNAFYLTRILAEQPESAPGQWNMMDVRPLEGFVFAVTPFNFTSIAGNLPTAPALMGNTVVWKPASSAVYSASFIMQLLREAGLPDGVINLVYGSGATVGDPVLASREFAGLHFTGSTGVFNDMWATIGKNVGHYRSYPRIVGETGGKDFIFAHASADPDALAVAIVRGGFEYQGQKCSAASRLYIPDSLWPKVRERATEMLREVRVGDVADFRNFMGAVIDKGAFRDHVGYIEHARAHANDYSFVHGGGYSDAEGYFIEPTLIESKDPQGKLMREEIFGPVVTAYVYRESAFAETLALCDSTSPYALTGAIFANDRTAIEQASTALRNAAGNFYINDKPTGAVVGQQPFGGARASGTNDKAGSILNLLRWSSPRAIKETLAPPTTWKYPFMDEGTDRP